MDTITEKKYKIARFINSKINEGVPKKYQHKYVGIENIYRNGSAWASDICDKHCIYDIVGGKIAMTTLRPKVTTYFFDIKEGV